MEPIYFTIKNIQLAKRITIYDTIHTIHFPRVGRSFKATECSSNMENPGELQWTCSKNIFYMTDTACVHLIYVGHDLVLPHTGYADGSVKYLWKTDTWQYSPRVKSP